jgi:hypothetical protein
MNFRVDDPRNPYLGLLVLAISFLALAISFIFYNSTIPTQKPKPIKNLLATPTPTHRVSNSGKNLEPLKLADTVGEINPRLSFEVCNDELGQAADRMEEGVVTYSAAGLPIITPYLINPSPSIRAAALDAVTRLGHRSAGMVLRDLAPKMSDPREAAAFMGVAEYLELEVPVDNSR